MFTLLTPARLCVGLILLYTAVLGLGYGRDRGWLVESDGMRRQVEFVGVRAAGELAMSGRPADAYDWVAHRAAHDRVVGKASTDYYTWPYPPPYLAVADLLARLPYVTAALLFLLLTYTAYGAVALRLGGMQRGLLPAFAAPTTLTNASIVHTGFLVAGLFGAALLHLPRRPVLAGVMFGLLAFKPQLGALIPFALIAGGYWTTIASATATAAALVVGSIGLYGIEPWLALPRQIERVATDILAAGLVNFDMLATVYGVLRRVGIEHGNALAVQGIVSLALVIGIWRLWRSAAAFDLKAAGLLVGTVLATPYLFLYDLTLLVVALLFLARERGLDRVELIGVLAGGVLLLGIAVLPLPTGALAAMIAGALVLRRLGVTLSLGTRISTSARVT